MSEYTPTVKNILETARKLFNSTGTSKISTNHIAKEAGISPGNLYYHFKNKEEIIRSLFCEMAQKYDPLWDSVIPDKDGFTAVADLIYYGFGLSIEYRFLYIELAVLLKNDPELRKIHDEIMKKRMDHLEKTMLAAMETGIFLQKDNSSFIKTINRLFWLINQFWFSFMEITGEYSGIDSQIEGTKFCIALLEPYLEPEISEKLNDYVKKLPAKLI